MLGNKSKEELEELFDTLDNYLHKETYMELQDKILCQQIDLDDMQSQIDMYVDNINNRGDNE